MALFCKLVWTSLKQQTTYRAAMLAGLATNLFFGFLRAAVMVALFANTASNHMGEMSLGEAINFVGVSQALIAFLILFGNTELMRTVYSGEIGSDLLRPLPLILYWLGRDLGKSLVNLLTRGIIYMLLFSLFFPVLLPGSAAQWLAFLLSLSLAWLASFAWRFLVNLSALWTPDAIGIGRAAFALSQLLGGFFMPLALLPDWFSQFARFTPFPAMLAVPLDIYLGNMPPEALPGALASQALWILALFALCLLVMRAGVRRLVIQGG